MKQLQHVKGQLQDNNQNTEVLPEPVKGVTGLLSNLIARAFIIKEHPIKDLQLEAEDFLRRIKIRLIVGLK